MRKLALVLVAGLLALTAAGCGEDDEGAATTAADTGAAATEAAGDECAKDTLQTVADGTLTIGTDNPAYPPWFDGGSQDKKWELNDPSTGKGFESAVSYAIADQLGFSKAEVEWTYVPFNNSFKPGPKDFDFDVNQISITPERAQAVDFSDSYYDVNQALVALEGTPIASATSVADLKQYKLGAQIGTTSFKYIDEQIQPDQDPSVYDTSNDVINALKAKQIDGIVVDLPTAFFIVAAELDGGTIVGQFPNVGGEQEQFGLVFEKGSPLVSCVNEAIATLKDDGTLADIQQQWLSENADAPVLE
ncbi:MAG TPA: ABC transporter substrate-binding protein [Gaiellaceae bacterium]|nr:ABC transporter substrate-binding protein [Gaiellaceae bacterium]